MNTKIYRWQQRIEEIKLELGQLGQMRPGVLTKQYNVCGKPHCRCKDPKRPQKHGPYYQLSYSHGGKSTTEFVKKEAASQVRQQVANYRRFRKLTDEWVALSLRIAQQQRQQRRR